MNQFTIMVFFHTAPCNGKKCENGGKLNVDTCTCKCEPPYIGDRCQQGRWSSTSVVFLPFIILITASASYSFPEILCYVNGFVLWL